ncbi:extracellular solute-binding protein [Jonesiaceae bacterium BS-20]|uniref:Extracellular solute-binding protein n=1 Tax=Jonesiaceae bacterium BS-20 TaxID=3120821 RepID=A0AAU7DSA0_9MICO
MRNNKFLRLAAGLVGMTMLATAACSAPNAGPADPAPTSSEGAGSAEPEAPAGEVPDKPSTPQKIHILDVAGATRITERGFEQFVKDHPDIISEITWESGGAPDLVGTIKPQVESGSLQVDLVLTGNDGLSSGAKEDLWIDIVGEYGDRVSNQANYVPGAVEQQKLANGLGVILTFSPSGPMLQYDPAVVTEDQVPSTPQELLDWAKANPGKFSYARPANSGVGRTFMQGLPYLLGDSDPKDPENGWDNTWAYLKELNQYVDYYTTGTGDMLANVANGTWPMTPITFGWDIEPRADSRVPNTVKVAPFDDVTFIADSHFAVIPKGQSADKTSAILNLIQYFLEAENNANAFDTGYHYPGPAIEGATLDMAAPETQDLIKEFGRDWYDQHISEHETQSQLDAEQLIKAFDIWDREIGSGKI